MPRRLPPMPDSPRDGPPPAISLCPRCSADGVITTGCQKPSLHQTAHGRFWDRFPYGAEDAEGAVSALRTPRTALQPLDAVPATNRARDLDDSSEESETDSSSLPEAEPLPLYHRRGNVLPPLPPRVEMAVLRKLYMAGMTVSPRSRQIKPLPQLGDRQDDDVPEAGWSEVEEDQEEDLPPTVYDPTLLDESLVRELSLDNLLRPDVQRPARLRLDPISGVKPIQPAQGLFCHRHSLVPVPALTESLEEE